jgi:mono/diheme cytochrome c family protein
MGNRKFRILFSGIVIASVLWTSCYYDKEALIYPPDSLGNCDTTAVTYSVQVSAVLNAYCLSCHSGTAVSGGGIKLDTYNSVLVQVNNGKLMKAIQHEAGASAMPKGSAKLSECNIAIVRTWVRNGAPNN